MAAGDRRQPLAGEWPTGGLETLDCCPACGDRRRSVLHEGVTDKVFLCAPGEWTLYRCGGCGAELAPNAKFCSTCGTKT